MLYEHVIESDDIGSAQLIYIGHRPREYHHSS